MYFINPKTIEELKQQYKKLTLKWHPDVTGRDTNKEMADINKEYEKLFNLLKHSSTYEKDFDANVNDGFREVIDKIIHLNISIEICGTWIWISGETKLVKDQLKEAGFWWAGKKKQWYWKPVDEIRSKRTKTLTMDEIREKYGSNKIKAASKMVAIGG